MRTFTILVVLLSIVALPLAVAQDEQEKPKRFIGKCDLEQLLEHDQQYADAAFIYIPDPDALAVFKAVKHPVTIRLFYRTDCHDSIREVPRFIKTIQLADNPMISTETIGVNVAKDQPQEFIEGWNLERVPTFIVVSEGKEIGRVIETAKEKIEIDLAGMLMQFTE